MRWLTFEQQSSFGRSGQLFAEALVQRRGGDNVQLAARVEHDDTRARVGHLDRERRDTGHIRKLSWLSLTVNSHW
jgi:hypothetical protein